MAEDPKYIDAWRRYRTWACLRLIAFLGYMPFVIAVLGGSRSSGDPSVGSALVLVWFLFFGVTVVGAGTFRCPRCNNRFFYTWFWSNPLTSRCLHCRLPKWATRDPVTSTLSTK
jgi:hypothetical protein